jgi:hypothetical protein
VGLHHDTREGKCIDGGELLEEIVGLHCVCL